MKREPRVESGLPAEAQYFQFHSGRLFRLAWAVAGVLSWPVILPLALVSRLSDVLFRSVSEALSVVPYILGVVVRYQFYRFSLRRCGRNVVLDFGVLFVYRDVCLGSHVYVARDTIIHHCDLGDYVLVSEGCSLLSGARYHRFARTDVPIAMQGGEKTRITIGPDCWIGARSVVMADVGEGSVVGAGSVVTRRVSPWSIVAGNPARLIRRRREI